MTPTIQSCTKRTAMSCRVHRVQSVVRKRSLAWALQDLVCFKALGTRWGGGQTPQLLSKLHDLVKVSIASQRGFQNLESNLGNKWLRSSAKQSIEWGPHFKSKREKYEDEQTNHQNQQYGLSACSFLDLGTHSSLIEILWRTQISKKRLASSYKLHFGLPTSIIRATFWLSVCHLKHNPASLGANDCKSFLTAKISRIAELSIAENGKPITLGGLLRPQLNIITAIFGILRVRKSNPDCTGFEPNATAIEMT